MTLYYTSYGLLLFVCVTSLTLKRRWSRVLTIYSSVILFFFLVLIAAMRAPSVDHDYWNYLDWFSIIKAGPLVGADFVKDPAFVVISLMVLVAHGGYPFVAGIYAALSLSTKWLVGRLAEGYALLPIFIYLEFCRFFLVQDMTAIRAAVAIPVMTLSVLAAISQRRKLAWILFLISLPFHASAVLGLPVLLLAMFGRIESRRIFVYLALGCALLFLAFGRSLNYLATMERMADYLNGAQDVSGLRLLSVYFVFRAAIATLLIVYFWNRTSERDRVVIFASVFGVALQVVLSSNNALALRSAEVFGLFDVLMFLAPLRLLHAEARMAYLLILVLLGAVFFNSSTEIMNPYQIAYCADHTHALRRWGPWPHEHIALLGPSCSWGYKMSSNAHDMLCPTE